MNVISYRTVVPPIGDPVTVIRYIVKTSGHNYRPPPPEDIVRIIYVTVTATTTAAPAITTRPTPTVSCSRAACTKVTGYSLFIVY